MFEDKDILADLMIVAASIYRRRDVLSLDKEDQAEAIRRLNDYCVLSLDAIASIVGVTKYRVEKAIGDDPRPVTRGHLNPAHIRMLLQVLATGEIPNRWLEIMTQDGTSVSTISDLTALSEAKIYRRKSV